MDSKPGNKSILVMSPEAETYRLDKEDGYNYRQRRHDQWTENYTLYRDTVIYNRLTQRQSVHIPLMKMSLRTLLAQYDDMPGVVFENLDNDKEKEVFLNEYWKWTTELNKFVVQDIVDKKQEQFYGRTYDQWQIMDGRIIQTIVSTDDILVSRNTNPINIHSSRYLIHTGIFVPISVLEQDENYDKEALERLKIWFGTEQGLIKAAENERIFNDKQQKLADLGLTDAFSPVFGETLVEIALYFKWDVARDGKSQEIYLTVLAEATENLMKKALEEHIGPTQDHFWQTHYPYNSWAGDIDIIDWFTDGVADIVRGSNRVVDTYYSQEVENRTLKNYNMHYYNGIIDGADTWAPSTWDPEPWAWYKVPGDPAQVIKDVQVQDLGEVKGDIDFIMNINERATGAVSTSQGVPTARKITLGEVQIDLSQAQERIKGMTIFYNQVWHERATMFLKLIEAAPEKLDAVKIYTKGRNTDNVYPREIAPDDWRSESGYRIRIWSQSEKTKQDTDNLEKQSAVKQNMPYNPVVDKIYKRKLVEWADYTPDEVKEVMDFEQQQRDAMANAMNNPNMVTQPAQTGAQPQTPPVQPQLQAPVGQQPMGGIG